MVRVLFDSGAIVMQRCINRVDRSITIRLVRAFMPEPGSKDIPKSNASLESLVPGVQERVRKQFDLDESGEWKGEIGVFKSYEENRTIGKARFCELPELSVILVA